MAHIRIPANWEIPDRLATPESIYLSRRQVLAGMGLGTLALGVGIGCAAAEAPGVEPARSRIAAPALGDRFAGRFPAPRRAEYQLGERSLTPEETAASHNNFYEFTTAKGRVWELAQGYSVDPWSVEIAGLVRQPRTLALEDLLERFPLEERLYRFRCVERWSMQVPWTGYPLSTLIDYLEPLPSAKYVRFVSFQDPDNLVGQRTSPWYPWPYFEGLRMDEARHELAFVVVGSYGHALPMQHGAPWRLALPWKYGYKSPKSIVRIEFTKRRPDTFWNETTPREYGFFSNVEPHKPHPRWSQAAEYDIGTGEDRETLLYNGYAEQVGGLYDGKEF